MIVVLDSSLEEQPLREDHEQWSLNYVSRELARKAKEKGYSIVVESDMRDKALTTATTTYTLGLVGMLSTAYSEHRPVALAPHDFWFVANCELAAIIAKNPDQFRGIFTSSEEKQTIMVPTTDPRQIDYTRLVELLEERFPNKEIKDLLIPDLSTMNSKVFNALCATVADSVQHYYSYMTFCCGIPKIKVLGTPEDYRKLAEVSRRLAELLEFNSETLAYYDRVSGLFDRMADSFTSEDPSVFWRSIYTQKNVGSGRQLDIDGWIRDFFTKRPARLEGYHTSIAAVPYKNLETGNEYLGLTGAFGVVRDSEGFWQSDFREAIFQKSEQDMEKGPPVNEKEEWMKKFIQQREERRAAKGAGITVSVTDVSSVVPSSKVKLPAEVVVLKPRQANDDPQYFLNMDVVNQMEKIMLEEDKKK